MNVINDEQIRACIQLVHQLATEAQMRIVSMLQGGEQLPKTRVDWLNNQYQRIDKLKLVMLGDEYPGEPQQPNDVER